MAAFEEALTAELECPICTDLLNDPKALHCLHRFCRDCLQSHIRNDRRAGPSSVSCPVCRQESRVSTPGVINADSFVTDIGMRNVVQTVKKTREDTSICERHTGNPVVLYCKSCKERLCHVCSGIDHRECEGVVSLQSVAAEERREVTVLLGKFRTKQFSLDKKNQDLKHKTETLNTRHHQEIKAARERFEKIHQILRRREEDFINEIDKEFQKAKKGYQLQEQRLRDEITATTDAVKFIETSLTKTDIQLLHLKCQRQYKYRSFKLTCDKTTDIDEKAKSLMKDTKLPDIEHLFTSTIGPRKEPSKGPSITLKRPYQWERDSPPLKITGSIF